MSNCNKKIQNLQGILSKISKTSFALLCTATLSACNGGGEDGDGAVSLLDQISPTPGGSGVLSSYYIQSFAPFESLVTTWRDSARYQLQKIDGWFFPSAPGVTYSSFSIAASRAEYAHALGLTGNGQTISIVDGGFLTGHETLSGKTLIVSGNTSSNDHGTGVASVAAGNSSSMVGIAPGADLALGVFTNNTTLAAATNRARQLGAVAQNNSWGYDGLDANATNFQLIFSGNAPTIGTATDPYLAALDAYAAQGVVVFAISNNTSKTSSTLMEALPALRPSLETGWLAVGNAVPTFDNTRVTSAQMISSDCHESARWCLVADGTWQAANGNTNSSYQLWTGSSFAAPQVSGALALLAEAFPTLTPHQLRTRLLASADNGFFTHSGTVELAPGFSHGYNEEFGHGFLDIRGALLPIGPTTMSIGEVPVAVSQPVVLAGSAMGDAVTRSLAGVDVAVSDSLNAGFSMPANALAATPAPRSITTPRMNELLAADMTRLRMSPALGLSDPFEAIDGQTMSFISTGDGIKASILAPNLYGDDASYGISMSKDLLAHSNTSLEMGLKFMHDGGGTIGFSDLNDGGLGADLAAVHFGLSHEFDSGNFLAINGEFGIGTLETPNLLQSDTNVQYDSIGMLAGRRNVLTRGDRLAFGLSMPMAITNGNAQIALPVARATGGSEIRSIGLDLAPEKRQLDLSITYQTQVTDNLEMVLELVHAKNHGNIADLEDTAGILAFSYKF